MPCLGLSVVSGPAIYLTCEDDSPELHWRQEHMCEALGVPMTSVAGKLHLVSLRGQLGNELATFGHDGRTSLTPVYHRLAATLKATGARLLILDNVAHLFTGNENDRGEVTRFANLLNRLAGETGAAIILIGHPNKNGDEWSCSTAWNNAFRSRGWMEHDEVTGLRHVTLPKANYSEKGDVVSFRWHNRAFVRDEDLPDDTAAQLREISLANAANSAFLACLRQRESEGIERAVGPHTGPNYAPSQFEGMPQAKGLKRTVLKQAMDRLYQAGLIETVQVERPGKTGVKSIIVEASPNSPNALPKADVVWFDSASIPSDDHLRHFFADLIRLTGGAPSIGFDPARWLARFERCGGMWAVRDGEALLLIPEGADLADIMLELDMRGGKGAVLDLIRVRHEAREA